MVPETGNGNQEGRMKNSGRVSQVAFVTFTKITNTRHKFHVERGS
jgi:hypothetical protein